jgi:nicotinate-nucleotide adenylyltransferase
MKIGLFGGAFDPIHNAHLFVAEAVRSGEGLDLVVFLPMRAAHHREPPRASVEDRATMVRLAIAPNPAFALDLADADETATGYTADLLPRMRARYPDDDLYFIAGGDSLARSPWRHLDKILAQLAGFLIAPRGDVSAADLDAALLGVPAHLRAKVRLIDLPRVYESATMVRDRLVAGRSARYLVPEPVWRYVVERRLYGRSDGSAIASK